MLQHFRTGDLIVAHDNDRLDRQPLHDERRGRPIAGESSPYDQAYHRDAGYEFAHGTHPSPSAVRPARWSSGSIRTRSLLSARRPTTKWPQPHRAALFIVDARWIADSKIRSVSA